MVTITTSLDIADTSKYDSTKIVKKTAPVNTNEPNSGGDKFLGALIANDSNTVKIDTLNKSRETEAISRQSLIELVSQLGIAVDVQHGKDVIMKSVKMGNGRGYQEFDSGAGIKTKAVVLTAEGVRKFGLDLNKVYKGCEFKPYVAKNGILDIRGIEQQAILLKAIIKEKPELKGKLGFYNVKGSHAVATALNSTILNKNRGAAFWTGDVVRDSKNLEYYQTPKIITYTNFSKNQFRNEPSYYTLTYFREVCGGWGKPREYIFSGLSVMVLGIEQ